MRESRPWWVYHLGLGALILAVVWIFPAGAARSTVQLMASLTVIPAVILGIRLNRPAYRLGWWALVAAVSTAVITNVTWPVLQAAHLLSVSPAIDLLYYLTYPILGFALAVLPALPPGQRRAGFTEAGIIAGAAAVVWWALLVDPLVTDAGRRLDQAHIMVFPLLDMVILALGLRLVLLTAAKSPSYLLIALGGAALLTADTAVFVASDNQLFMQTVNSVAPPVLSQTCWLLCNILLGAGALHPSMSRVVEPDNGEFAGRIGASRIYVATVVATPVLTGIFLLSEITTGDLETADVIVPVGATAFTSALVVLRMRQLNVLVRQRAADLEQSLHKEAELQQELRHRAQYDDMTRLPNRTVMHDRITSMLHTEAPGSLMILDLDEFKEVNDRFGHAMGDDLLVAVAERLSRLLDGRALVARLGSDEFGVVLTAASTAASASAAASDSSLTDASLADASLADAFLAVADEVLVVMRRPVLAQGHELFATASIGLRVLDGESLTGDVVRDAYVALHAAKAAGRDQIKVFDRRMREERLAVAQTVERLRGAVGRDELLVYYQPLIRLADESMVGVEALLRWKPPGGRMVPPDEFISIAEDSGLIVPIGEWVLRESCRVVAGWHHRTGTHPVVSVNVSPRQLREPGFGATVLDALRDSGLPPEALILEITEGVLVASGQVTEQAIGHLSMVRGRGVKVAVDDFGTGYSSLAYLRDLPIDHIKIDRSFMPAPGEPDPAAQTLVRAIIDLAGGLGLGTIAEGVETAEQVELLRSLGCERAQGFFFARPVPEPEAAALLSIRAAHPSV